MASVAPKVAGTSHSEQVSIANKTASVQKEVKAFRAKILKGQEKKEANLKQVVDKRRNPTSKSTGRVSGSSNGAGDGKGFSAASKVKLSKAATANQAIIKRNGPQEFIQRATATAKLNQGKLAQEKPSQTADLFFQRLDNIQTNDDRSALDNFHGNVQLKPTTHRIDLQG